MRGKHVWPINAEQREVVKLRLEPVVPQACNIQNTHVGLTLKKHPHLKGIWFSDVGKSVGWRYMF